MDAASMTHNLISTEPSRMFKAGSGLIDHCLVKDASVRCGS